LFTVVDLSAVWIAADLYERDGIAPFRALRTPRTLR
jgi:hypothetical protein